MAKIESYELVADDVHANIEISHNPKDYVPVYEITYPLIEEPTKAALDEIRERMIAEIFVEPREIMDPKELEEIKKEFSQKAIAVIKKEFPNRVLQNTSICKSSHRKRDGSTNTRRIK